MRSSTPSTQYADSSTLRPLPPPQASTARLPAKARAVLRPGRGPKRPQSPGSPGPQRVVRDRDADGRQARHCAPSCCRHRSWRRRRSRFVRRPAATATQGGAPPLLCEVDSRKRGDPGRGERAEEQPKALFWRVFLCHEHHLVGDEHGSSGYGLSRHCLRGRGGHKGAVGFLLCQILHIVDEERRLEWCRTRGTFRSTSVKGDGDRKGAWDRGRSGSRGRGRKRSGKKARWRFVDRRNRRR